MKSEGSTVSLLTISVGGFVFSFSGALLAVAISQLFLFAGDYWIIISAIGATVVSTWGWLYWLDSVSKQQTDLG